MLVPLQNLALTIRRLSPFISRFLFFPPIDDGKSNQVNALAKSDKKAFKSVAAVLHLSQDDAVGGRLSANMFDLKDVKTKKPTANRRREY